MERRGRCISFSRVCVCVCVEMKKATVQKFVRKRSFYINCTMEHSEMEAPCKFSACKLTIVVIADIVAKHLASFLSHFVT